MIYTVLVVIVRVIARIIYRFNVTGLENIPNTGACILCSNHIHAFDPVMIAILLNRKPSFMAKKEIFSSPLASWFYGELGAFPVDREKADMKAYRKSMQILEEGEMLLMFAQGTRMAGFENAKGGVAMFALKSGAPIIPVGINGTFRLFSKLKIEIGEPILMDKYEGQKVKSELIEEVMNVVSGRITELCK